MEPLKPKDRAAILAAGTISKPELEEYETLLSRRFTGDPHLTMMGAPRKRASFSASQEKRLGELYAKFPQAAERTRVHSALGEREYVSSVSKKKHGLPKGKRAAVRKAAKRKM